MDRREKGRPLTAHEEAAGAHAELTMRDFGGQNGTEVTMPQVRDLLLILGTVRLLNTSAEIRSLGRPDSDEKRAEFEELKKRAEDAQAMQEDTPEGREKAIFFLNDWKKAFPFGSHWTPEEKLRRMDAFTRAIDLLSAQG